MYGIPDVLAAWTIGIVIAIVLLVASSGGVPKEPTQMVAALLFYVALFWFFGQTYFIPAALVAVGFFAVYLSVTSKRASTAPTKKNGPINMGKPRPVDPYESIGLPENSRKSRRSRSGIRNRSH